MKVSRRQKKRNRANVGKLTESLGNSKPYTYGVNEVEHIPKTGKEKQEWEDRINTYKTLKSWGQLITPENYETKNKGNYPRSSSDKIRTDFESSKDHMPRSYSAWERMGKPYLSKSKDRAKTVPLSKAEMITATIRAKLAHTYAEDNPIRESTVKIEPKTQHELK